MKKPRRIILISIPKVGILIFDRKEFKREEFTRIHRGMKFYESLSRPRKLKCIIGEVSLRLAKKIHKEYGIQRFTKK